MGKQFSCLKSSSTSEQQKSSTNVITECFGLSESSDSYKLNSDNSSIPTNKSKKQTDKTVSSTFDRLSNYKVENQKSLSKRRKNEEIVAASVSCYRQSQVNGNELDISEVSTQVKDQKCLSESEEEDKQDLMIRTIPPISAANPTRRYEDNFPKLPNKEADVASDDVIYEHVTDTSSRFRDLVTTETNILNDCIKTWTSVLEQADTNSCPNEVCDEIRATIGKTRLIINQRFQQFLKLIDQSESDKNQRKVYESDLEGFWDMDLIQVDKVKKDFNQLEERKSNQWQLLGNNNAISKSKPIAQKKKQKKIQTPQSEKIRAAQEERRKKIMQMRKEMMKKKKSEIIALSEDQLTILN